MVGLNLIVDESTQLQKVVLRRGRAASDVYLHGAHVTSYKDDEGQDVIFTSSQAVFAPPKAIRGGIPVCFPQFGGMGPLGQHGFARNRSFTAVDGDASSVTLELSYAGDEPKYPHPFKLRITVSLTDKGLEQQLHVQNTGSDAMKFTAALHTYFSVTDIDQVSITGLHGLSYLDNLQSQKELREAEEAVVFGREVDRVYKQAPDSIKILDKATGRVITVHKHNFPDAVVWNPWVDKAKSLADFGDEEYKRMLCIEPAVAASGAVSVGPGDAWTAKQILSTSKL